MDPISNVDQLVLLLRQRLLERSRPSATSRTEKQHAVGEVQSSRAGAAQALAGVDGVDDHQLGRALIQNLLADQFGRQLINDAKFQQVVDQVTRTLEEDDASSGLLARVIGELRASAREDVA